MEGFKQERETAEAYELLYGINDDAIANKEPEIPIDQEVRS